MSSPSAGSRRTDSPSIPDFTVAETDLDVAGLVETFAEIASWQHERCGLRRTAGHLASGHLASGHLAEVSCYSLPELLGEKTRALAERCRPRDLYDVVHLYRHMGQIDSAGDVLQILAAKCAYAGIDVPTLSAIRSTPFRNEIETEWSNMLGHQLPYLSRFEDFWARLDDVFAWLTGNRPRSRLTEIRPTEPVTDWRPARHTTSWPQGPPIELIRFAGANRLKITIDYHPAQGRVRPRTVEPYALRRNGPTDRD